MLGTCVGESVVMIIKNVVGKEAILVSREKKAENSRIPKQTILNDDKPSNNVTLYILTDIEVITKSVTKDKEAKCGSRERVKRGDKVTIQTTAHLYSAELKGKKNPGC